VFVSGRLSATVIDIVVYDELVAPGPLEGPRAR
jgi:hypothetical protein